METERKISAQIKPLSHEGQRIAVLLETDTTLIEKEVFSSEKVALRKKQRSRAANFSKEVVTTVLSSSSLAAGCIYIYNGLYSHDAERVGDGLAFVILAYKFAQSVKYQLESGRKLSTQVSSLKKK